MPPDWLSLPSEILGHIADCLLATNDVDCYMDFRAVCNSWRSATEDPKSDPSDLRFHPRRWILVDEVFQSDERLMVNTATGRILRKALPLLRRYEVTATTPCGFFVLADLEPPHAACVLNPLSGHLIRFKASVLFELDISAAAFSTGSSPQLVLLSDRSYELYTAAPDSEHFSVPYCTDEGLFPYVSTRLAVGGGMHTDGVWGWLEHYGIFVTRNVAHVLEQFSVDGSKMFSYHNSKGFADLPGTGHSNHCFLVECGRQPLIIIMQQDHRFGVFSMDTAGDVEIEPVTSIGGRAIFVGYRRSLSVGTKKFPSIAANCIYYGKSTDSSLDIYKYNLETEQEERVSEAIDSLNPDKLSLASTPFTIVQLL